MDKEELKRIASDPKNIPGIYNYCDRWCERCQFTSRCANFTISQSQFDDPESLDAQNEKYWLKLSEIMQVTLEMVQDFAEENGIDLSVIDNEAHEQQEAKIQAEVKQFECTQKSLDYVKIINRWLKENQPAIDQKIEDLAELEEIGIATSIDELTDISDILEIIHWYKHQINVKIMRAKRSKMEEEADDDDFPKDSDGSAKVALIGIDRSISAWGKMLDFFPASEDELLKILVRLERLRRSVEKEFPDARAFVRPGFDE